MIESFTLDPFLRVMAWFLATLFAGCCPPQRPPQVLPANLPERWENSLGVEMQLVPAGSFIMGSNREYPDRSAPQSGRTIAYFSPEHEVYTDAYYMARFEVTVGQFEEFARERGLYEEMASYNIDFIKRFTIEDPWGSEGTAAIATTEGMPSLDWYTAVDFCKWLSAREGRRYRLPTEAEWERAARAGTRTAYWYGEEGHPFINGTRRDFIDIRAVGAMSANPWGFHDMLTRVPEWTVDRFQAHYWTWKICGAENPKGALWGPLRVQRGTQPGFGRFSSTCEFRIGYEPKRKNGGIRLVCEIDETFVPPPPPQSVASPMVDVADDLIYESWELGPGVELKMVWIRPGRFILGSPEDEAVGYASGLERPRVEIFFPRGFYMAETELTQAQYAAVMGEDSPSEFQGPQKPVTGLMYSEYKPFLAKLGESLLTEEQRRAGTRFRLPTEFQWEYACRAGTTTAYSFGDDERLLEYYGHCDVLGGPRPVAQKLPNPWGLYDMHGNVWERCDGSADVRYWYFQSWKDPIDNPMGGRGSTNPLRGGGGASVRIGRARRRAVQALVASDTILSVCASCGSSERTKRLRRPTSNCPILTSPGRPIPATRPIC